MNKHSGFTLIELMITLAIVGILLAVGVPSLKAFMQGNQLVATSNELLSALHIARSEAIKLNKRVTICESSNGTSCSATGNWKNGWIVFTDALGATSGTAAICTNTIADCLLRVHEAIADNQLSVSGAYTGGGAISSFTFTSRGLPKDSTGASQSGIFSVCSFDDTDTVIGSRAVVLSLSGRVRVSDDSAVIICPTTP